MEINLTPKQSMLISTTANEVFWGGALSSGKSFSNIITAISVCMEVPNAQVAILRNTSKNLRKNYFAGDSSVPSILSDYIQAKKVKINYSEMIVSFWNGAAIHFMHSEHVGQTIENLTGIQFVLVIFDEASLIHKDIINFSKTRLRLGSLKIENDFWRTRLPRLQLTSNPGGISHSYLRDKYITPSEPMKEFVDEYGKTLIFIPAFFYDNPTIDHEAYEKEIRSMGDPIKIAQLLEGNWDIGAASLFENSFRRDKNVLPTFTIPEDWLIYRTMDDGWSSPFSINWICTVKSQDPVIDSSGKELFLPYGTRIVIDEWYGYNGEDRAIGLKMEPKEIAKGILKREEEYGYGDRVRPGGADNSIWNTDRPVAADMQSMGVRFVRSDKSKGSRVRGWRLMDEMMKNAHAFPVEQPALYFMEHCIHIIEDISTAPISKKDPSDLDSASLDHTLDSARYELTSTTSTFSQVKVTGL